jgi:hypothetical protein
MSWKNSLVFWLAVVLIAVVQTYAIGSRSSVTPRSTLVTGIVVWIGIILLILSRFGVLEGYYPDYQKDYCKAMRCGQVVGGAVYASDPGNTPGLGWLP